MARPITAMNRSRLQAHLRAILGCSRLWVDAPSTRDGTAQLRIGAEVMGTVDQVEDEGERSWVVTLIVLAEDLTG